MTTFRDLIGPGRFIDPAVIQASAARGTTRYPYAAWMPITPEHATQPRITPTTVIHHSMSGPRLTSLEALVAYFNRDDVHIESTFVGPDFDGRVAQVLSTDQRADCNYKANGFAASTETQDRGYLEDPGIANTPWSDPQLAQLAGIDAFYHLRHGVPLRRPPVWDGGGIDGHRAFPEWSKYRGKTCPGETRWHQIDDVLVGAQWIVDWTPQSEEDEMTKQEMETLVELIERRVWDTKIQVPVGEDQKLVSMTREAVLREAHQLAGRAVRAVDG